MENKLRCCFPIIGVALFGLEGMTVPAIPALGVVFLMLGVMEALIRVEVLPRRERAVLAEGSGCTATTTPLASLRGVGNMDEEAKR